MKNLLITLLVLTSFSASAQVVSGLYAGQLYNDTTKMFQKYEVALSEYRGKITGYSYTTFVVNDTFYYGIRTVKATKKEGKLIIEDDKMIVNNFPESPAKRVHRTSTIALAEVDTVTNLTGRWQTNRTKEYYAVTGSLEARRDNDSTQSALIDHLKELKLIPSGNAAMQATANTNKNSTKKETQASKPAKEVSTPPTTLSYLERQNKIIETIETGSDSLSFSFYDNGVVDGDIISVYLNGQNVVDKALLKESATKKTVAIPKTDEDIVLLLVAETLGTIPPNTGLLIIHDGTKRYEVRFSADLQTNASIIIRQKK